MGLIFVVWFLPLVGALVLGFFLKKASIVERGPSGPLAVTTLLALVLAFGAVGCGKSESPQTAGSPAKQETTAKQEAAAKSATESAEPKLPKALEGAENFTLANREETGIIPSPMGQTLADVYTALSASAEKCSSKRNGDRVQIAAKLARGTMTVEFTPTKTPDGNMFALVEDMTTESDRDPIPNTAEGTEAHATLMQFVAEHMKALEGRSSRSASSRSRPKPRDCRTRTQCSEVSKALGK